MLTKIAYHNLKKKKMLFSLLSFDNSNKYFQRTQKAQLCKVHANTHNL